MEIMIAVNHVGLSPSQLYLILVSISCIQYSPLVDLVATGSSCGELKLWKISENFRKIEEMMSYAVVRFWTEIIYFVYHRKGF